MIGISVGWDILTKLSGKLWVHFLSEFTRNNHSTPIFSSLFLYKEILDLPRCWTPTLQDKVNPLPTVYTSYHSHKVYIGYIVKDHENKNLLFGLDLRLWLGIRLAVWLR
jgi:hypothetical protein